MSAWGNAWSGNEFTLNAAGNAARPEDAGLTGVRPLRWLSAQDCAEGLAVERKIRDRFPAPPPGHEVWSWSAQPDGGIFRDALAKLQVVREELWRPGLDLWLPYFALDDVSLWADYLLARLLPLLARAEVESLPPDV